MQLVKEKKNPNIFIGTDIITGFPGESEVEFQESVQLQKILEISKIHAFHFLSGKGTIAESLKDNVSKEEKERVKILNNLSHEQYKNFELQGLEN